MIEFNGYLSGSAEKRWIRNNRVYTAKLLIISSCFVLPTFIIWGIKAENWLMVGMVTSLFLIFPSLVFIPQTKKDKHDLTPKNIVIYEDGYITSKMVRMAETKSFSDIKIIKDHGEFYELIFPFGKFSNNFICQKNLLIKGTLEEFEALFEEKIIRVGSKVNQG